MLNSQKIAIAAHLHVLLRRKTGRITDTEWLAKDAAYAAEIVRFARASALEDGHADLAAWADKLEAAMLGTALPARPSKTVAQSPAQVDPQGERDLASTLPGIAGTALRYVRGIR
jgi:hypothetical protein